MKYESLKELKPLLDKLDATRVFLVTGNASYRACGAEYALRDAFAGREVLRFKDFCANPKWSDVLVGLDAFRKFNPDIMIAVGGGSPMDMAKLIDCSANLNGDVEFKKLLSGSDPGIAVPMIAIPTTAGSGSEATRFAVLYVNGEKQSIALDSILPQYVFIDSQLGLSMSPYQKAVSGIDAVSQAVESLWAVNATRESREYASEALEILWGALPGFVAEGKNAQAVFEGSYLAGKAINISKTTACHALSYYLTSEYGVPHGHAVALFAAPVLGVNYDIKEETAQKGVNVDVVKTAVTAVMNAVGASSPAEFRKLWQAYMKNLGLETDLAKLINKELGDIAGELAASVNMERLGNNPRKLSYDDIVRIVGSVDRWSR